MIRRQVYDANGVKVSVGTIGFADAQEYCSASFRPLECVGLDDAGTLVQISFHVENSSDRPIVFTPQLATIRIGGERAESLQVSYGGLLVDYPPGAEARGVGVWALRMPHLDAFGADRLRLSSDAPYVSDDGNFTDVGPELDVKLTW